MNKLKENCDNHSVIMYYSNLSKFMICDHKQLNTNIVNKISCYENSIQGSEFSKFKISLNFTISNQCA